MPTRRAAALALALLLAAVGTAHARRVACEVTYGGETRRLIAAPVDSPYAVKPEAIGSYFLFRIVLQTPPSALPAIKLYVYGDREDGPVPIHVAEYPYPPSPRTVAPGFTGYQTVYEPMRDGELQYWCALEGGRR